MIKQSYTVYGMTCQVCAHNVERTAKKVAGVVSASVNLLSNTLEVESNGGIPDELIIDAVRNIGYHAVSGCHAVDSHKQFVFRRLFFSIGFLIPLLVISFLSGLGIYFNAIPCITALLEFFLVVGIFWLNRSYFVMGIPALFRGKPNMDSLVSLGSLTAGIYSIFVMVEVLITSESSSPLYFESAGMILTLVSVGKYLESRSKDKTMDSVSRLLDLNPKSATVLRNGEERVIPVSDVVPGDTVIVTSGSQIPVDGRVCFGVSSVDESALTGESLFLT